MQTVRCPIHVMNASFLPAQCVITGSRDDVVWKIWTFHHHPRWSYLLLLAGLLPGMIAMSMARKMARVALPITRALRTRVMAAQIGVWLMMIPGLSGIFWWLMFAFGHEIIPSTRINWPASLFGATLFILAWGVSLWLRWRLSPRLRDIDPDTNMISLGLRDEGTAMAIQDKLGHSNAGLTETSACCAHHPDAPAIQTCIRCGDFLCEGCHTHHDAGVMALCAACNDQIEVQGHEDGLGLIKRNPYADTAMLCALLGVLFWAACPLLPLAGVGFALPGIWLSLRLPKRRGLLRAVLALMLGGGWTSFIIFAATGG